MSPSRMSLLLVPIALLAAAAPAAAQTVTLGPDVPPPSPPGSELPVTQTLPWSVTGTARGGQDVLVDFHGYGGCQSRPVVAVAESATSVRITVTTTVPGPGANLVCPAILRTTAPETVTLKAPLAGRRIIGREREAVRPYGSVRATAGRNPARLVVPDVRGLRRTDARAALCVAGLASRTAGPGRPAATPVRGQTPKAGRTVADDPATRAVRRDGKGCSGAAWKRAPRVTLLMGAK